MYFETLEVFEDKAETEQGNCRSLNTEGKSEQRDNPCRHRRSYVRAEYDADALRKRKDLRVYKAYDHNRGRP